MIEIEIASLTLAIEIVPHTPTISLRLTHSTPLEISSVHVRKKEEKKRDEEKERGNQVRKKEREKRGEKE
jgi:hypothetical protein